LVENGDVCKFSDALVKILNDSEGRKRMARNAVQNVQRYNIEHIAQYWKRLFDWL
jgi:glycosyltransferase involved in cell wall biosynthesis